MLNAECGMLNGKGETRLRRRKAMAKGLPGKLPGAPLRLRSRLFAIASRGRRPLFAFI